MNKRELIDMLEELDCPDDTEIRLAFQKGYSLEYNAETVALADPELETCEVCDGSCVEDDGDQEIPCTNCDGTGHYRDDSHAGEDKIIYIGEGYNIGYLPSFAVDALGWPHGR